MNEVMKATTQRQPLWGGIDDMSKQEKRELLFKEAGDCCMICGCPHNDDRIWSMVRITPGGRSQYVRIDARTIICDDCFRKKGRMSISAYVSTLPFAERWAYWRRIQRGFLKGIISADKKNLLMSDFTLLRRGVKPLPKAKTDKRCSGLYKETNGTCIYCGTPLIPNCATLDHIFPRSLGGTGAKKNLVLSCPDCNNDKGNMPVDEYVLSMTDKRRKAFIHRVRDLARSGTLPVGKARLLLSFEGAHTRHFRFRFFNRLFHVTVTQSKV